MCYWMILILLYQNILLLQSIITKKWEKARLVNLWKLKKMSMWKAAFIFKLLDLNLMCTINGSGYISVLRWILKKEQNLSIW